MSNPMLLETIWADKGRADDAERLYQERLAGGQTATGPIITPAVAPCNKSASPASNNQSKGSAKPSSTSSLVDEIARARQQIKNSLQSASTITPTTAGNLDSRVQALENETKDLKNVVEDLKKSLSKLETIISTLQGAKPVASKPVVNGIPAKTTATPKSNKDDDDDDDDMDLFGSDEEEDEEAIKLKEKRVAEYAAKKSKKTAVIAKSSVVLDVKPWDDETDMAALEKEVRTIQMDGLVWGASKLVPLAFGIKKLQIVTIVEDEKVSIEDLQEKIEAFEDLVQSVDIAAFNKL